MGKVFDLFVGVVCFALYLKIYICFLLLMGVDGLFWAKKSCLFLPLNFSPSKKLQICFLFCLLILKDAPGASEANLRVFFS